MKKWLYLAGCVLITLSLKAQTQTVYRIKAGQELGEVMKFNDVYRYPAFQFGTVIFRDDKQATALLNYNLLSGEMDFVNRDRDTMALNNEQTIRFVLIDPDTFYYADKGFIRQLAAFGNYKLGKRDVITLADSKKIGAYGFPAAAGIESYSSWKSFRLKMKVDLTLIKQSIYYFSNRNQFLQATRKNLLKVFPKREIPITNYLNEHAVDFTKENDLLRLFSFLKSIEKGSYSTPSSEKL